MVALSEAEAPISGEAADRYEAAKLRGIVLGDAAALVGLYARARSPQVETRSSMLEWLEGGGGLLLESARGEPLSALRWREEGGGWRLDGVATLPEARGKGYGRWFMTKLEALAIRNNIPSLTLSIPSPTAEVLRYYQRMGYQVLERREAEVTLQKCVGGTWQYKR